jgi:hypothetical protein
MTHYLSLVIASLLSIISYSTVTAQQAKTTVKVIVVEKTVDENGNINENKVIKTGEEAEEYMKEMNISQDSNTWTNDEGEEIDLDRKEYKFIQKKKVKMIQKDDDGNEEVIEWSGEGDIPDEIKEKMEEHDIDIIMDDKSEEIEVTVDNDGLSSHSKIKILKNQNGENQEIEIDVEGEELSDEIKEMLKAEGIDLSIIGSEDGSEKTIMVVTDDDEVEMNNNKAQLGVYLNTLDKGVKVAGVIEGSSAESAGMKEGDVITAIGDNDVSTMEEVVKEIGQYAVGDIVIVHFTRDDKVQSREVTLQSRKSTNELIKTDTYKKIIEVENDGSKKVEKYIIIEKEK